MKKLAMLIIGLLAITIVVGCVQQGTQTTTGTQDTVTGSQFNDSDLTPTSVQDTNLMSSEPLPSPDIP